MDNIVEKIKTMFIKEASESPILFNDLANLEKYVSESYSGRSLIELLQNADDAMAKKFFLKKIDNKRFIVANDGRYFTDEDLFSLCRSGASTKKRKENTIGYRGIGFKSVVNYAENVFLYSNTMNALFSKKLTQETLKTCREVPLIRIPHNCQGTPYDKLVDDLYSKGYTTIFVFETHNSIWEQEVSSFDSSCMLFLNSINNITFENEVFTSFSTTKVPFMGGEKIVLNENDECAEWYVKKSDVTTSKSSVAFKLKDNVSTPASKRESVVHSFMPTLTHLSIPIKINGDFSTDPSRTRVNMDDDTLLSIKECVDILGNLLKQILDEGIDKLGITNLVSIGKVDPLSKIKGEDVNDFLCKLLKNFVLDYLKEKTNNREMYLQPNGMDSNDFIAITNHHDIYGFSAEQNENIPGLFDLLRGCKITYLPSTLSVNAMKTIECTDSTKVSVVGALIEETRLGICNELKENIKEAQIFKFTSGTHSINDANDEVALDEEFEGSILDTVASPREFESFAKKIGIKTSSQKKTLLEEHQFKSGNNIEVYSSKIENQTKAIKKWRTVELNVAEVLKLSENVVSVKDVSKQNIGYDLDVTLKDGTKRYYEVKSVDGFNDSFSITNNEYATANTNKQNYYLAIANISENSVEVCFIKNPIDTLRFIKRVTRWEWICEEYSGETIKVKIKD